MTHPDMKQVDAVLLAGGKGTRLAEHTREIPKPLVPVGGRPIIEYLLGRLKAAGIVRVHLCVNHLAHMLEEVLADGSRFGLKIKYWDEEKPLSTVGPLRQIDKLSDNFIVANGDVLTDLDLAELYRYHLESNSRLTVATYKRPTKIDYGVLEVGDDRRVTGFREKPVYDFTVSMGIYVFSRSLLDDLPPAGPFGFDDLMYRMLENGEPVATFPYDGYWLDVGRPDDLVQANRDIEGMKGKF